MKLEIKAQPPIKKHIIFVRIDDPLFDQIKILERKHKVDRSSVVRSLIEAGLKSIK